MVDDIYNEILLELVLKESGANASLAIFFADPIKVNGGFMQTLQALLDKLPDLFLLIDQNIPVLHLLLLKLLRGILHERLPTPLFLQVRHHNLLKLNLAQLVHHGVTCSTVAAHAIIVLSLLLLDQGHRCGPLAGSIHRHVCRIIATSRVLIVQ